jgi:hypothetical protein
VRIDWTRILGVGGQVVRRNLEISSGLSCPFYFVLRSWGKWLVCFSVRDSKIWTNISVISIPCSLSQSHLHKPNPSLKAFPVTASPIRPNFQSEIISLGRIAAYILQNRLSIIIFYEFRGPHHLYRVLTIDLPGGILSSRKNAAFKNSQATILILAHSQEGCHLLCCIGFVPSYFPTLPRSNHRISGY